MRHYLVVANQTLGGDHLLERIRYLAAQEPSSFHVVVPATQPHDQWTWTESRARAIASRRLEQALERFAAAGAQVSGQVGDPHPMVAIADALAGRTCDEILLSTLPAGPSQWLRQDLPRRVERAFNLPVTHVVVQPEPAGAA